MNAVAPLIYEPHWTQLQLWQAAVKYMKAACVIWNVPEPMLFNYEVAHGRKYGTGGTHYGHWISRDPNGCPRDRIWVNVQAATAPAKVRGRIWSFPGYKTDRTCSGILLHEFAHHMAGNKKMDGARWREIVKTTKPVTSYEPTPDEAWAESTRIFIGNPDLLACARPERYTFIAQYFPPLHELSWEQVLMWAPDFIRQQAAKFAMEGARRVSLV